MVPIICRLEGRDAMLRVPNLDPGLIKKGLDMGCSCIMVPQVDNAEQARLAVEYCKFPPEGNRGVGPVWPMLLDVDINDYLESANRETCVIVQVETAEGLANLERIAEVEGVDVVFAGPADISASMGHLGNIGHPEVQEMPGELSRPGSRLRQAQRDHLPRVRRLLESLRTRLPLHKRRQPHAFRPGRPERVREQAAGTGGLRLRLNPTVWEISTKSGELIQGRFRPRCAEGRLRTQGLPRTRRRFVPLRSRNRESLVAGCGPEWAGRSPAQR